jgi:dienelactone hydrolase
MPFRTTVLVAALLALAAVAPALAYDPGAEAQNYAKIGERWSQEQANPEYQQQLHVDRLQGFAELGQIVAGDPERNPVTLCAAHYDGCAGDVRLYDWGEKDGIVREVLWTNRNGATVSGHLWAPLPADRGTPRRLPGVVITNGSVQAPEEAYWWAAQTLAQHGYVVLTWDPQGQGRTDALGSGEDMFRGFPAQQAPNFVEGTEDALDFFFSTRRRPYVPRRPSGAAKQEARVAAGRAAPFNPLHRTLDRAHVGIAGHSLGAFGVSVVGPSDPRVDALVAWDNLTAGGTNSGAYGSTDPITPRIPALGFSNDYGLTPTPFTSDPDPEAKNAAFETYRRAGVDAMQLNIRGGTHYEYSYIPNPAFGATLRGVDLAAWYTTAWFDKYLKGRRSADRRLLSDRWRADAPGAAIDPGGDGNLFSFYHRSRLALTTEGGARVACDDLRAGCAALVPRDQDGFDGEWSYLRERLRPESRDR